MIIGLTGKNASGKGEAAQYLRERGFLYLSLSDALRDELKKKRRPITRKNLIWLGNKLRNDQGPSVLAEKIFGHLLEGRNYIIDSFRNPEEVKLFRRSKDFRLLSIEASQKKRFQRIRSRNREKDARTFAEFVNHEKQERSSQDPTKQNLNACAELADYHLSNNESLSHFHRKLNKTLVKLLMFKPRPNWDQYFMQIAHVVASRSNCMKRKVAALLVKDRRIISTGYNGTPRGTKNCNEGGCVRCNALTPSGKNLSECTCSHAEENAIVQSSYHGISIKGSSLYSTYSPCHLCTKMIINGGISEVVFNDTYPMGKDPIRLLKQAHIKVRTPRKSKP